MLNNIDENKLITLGDLQREVDPNIKYIGNFLDSSIKYVNIKYLEDSSNAYVDNIWFHDYIQGQRGFISLDNLGSYIEDSSSKILVNKDILKRSDVELLIPIMITGNTLENLNQMNAVPILINKSLIKDLKFSFATIKKDGEGNVKNIDETTDILDLCKNERFLDNFQYRYLGTNDEYQNGKPANSGLYSKDYDQYLISQKSFILLNNENPKGVIKDVDYNYFISDEYILMLVCLEYNKKVDESFNLDRSILNSDHNLPNSDNNTVLISNSTLKDYLKDSIVVSRNIMFGQFDFPKPRIRSIQNENTVDLPDSYFKSYNGDRDIFKKNELQILRRDETSIDGYSLNDFNSIKIPPIQLKYHEAEEKIFNTETNETLSIGDEILFGEDISANVNLYSVNVNPIQEETGRQLSLEEQVAFYTLALEDFFSSNLISSFLEYSFTKISEVSFQEVESKKVRIYNTDNTFVETNVKRIVPYKSTEVTFTKEIEYGNSQVVTGITYNSLKENNKRIYDDSYVIKDSLNRPLDSSMILWYALDDSSTGKELKILKDNQIID